MVNSLFTVVSERTVSTTKQYNVTESFLRQSFYPYCQFTKTPILRLRGLCKPSNINTYYTLKYVNGSIVYKGVTDSPIEFLLSGFLSGLLLSMAGQTMGYTLTDEKLYIIGRNIWNIAKDSYERENGEPYWRVRKMSGCSEGQFTFNNGFCLKM